MKTTLVAIALSTLVSTPAMASEKLHRDIYICVAAYEWIGHTKDKVSSDHNHIVSRAYATGKIDPNRVRIATENVIANLNQRILYNWLNDCRFYKGPFVSGLY